MSIYAYGVSYPPEHEGGPTAYRLIGYSAVDPEEYPRIELATVHGNDWGGAMAELVERVRALPGVTAVTFVGHGTYRIDGLTAHALVLLEALHRRGVPEEFASRLLDVAP